MGFKSKIYNKCVPFCPTCTLDVDVCSSFSVRVLKLLIWKIIFNILVIWKICCYDCEAIDGALLVCFSL